MPELSQLDVIAQGKWEKALFTTYALSLTYFESYVLPKLQQTGCQHVTILTDIEGYRISTMEARAQHVGQDYALIPVANAAGIFHPKLTYLWGAENEDILLVGSGNLTYGGHGRNLEVLEALTPSADATAFENFSGFLKALLTRHNLKLGDTASIKDFAARAAAISTGKGASGAKLLHSVNRSIHEQLLDAARNQEWDELFILSPFHSSNGEPIRGLVQELGVKRLKIGVSGASNACCSFPFSMADEFGVDVSAVSPANLEERRALHAKWLELRGATTWVCTGSVNATAQSMGSVRNIEVGVLRELQNPTSDRWKTIPLPDYKENTFLASGTQNKLSVFAELTTDGALVGNVLGAGSHDGDWFLSIESTGAILHESVVNIDAFGHFRIPKLKLPSSSASGRQVRLTQGEREARGWLSVQSMLRLNVSARRAAGAFRRMLDRTESIEDIVAFIGFLSIHTHRALQLTNQIPPQGHSALESEVSSNSSDVEVNIDELFHDVESSRNGTEPALLWGEAGHSVIVLEAITRILLGRTQTKGEGSSHDSPTGQVSEQEDEDDEGAEERRQSDRVRIQDAVSKFRNEVRVALQGGTFPGRSRVSVLMTWSGALLDMYVFRLKSVDDARAFLPELFLEAIRHPAAPEERAALDELVFGVAAALAALPDVARRHIHIHEFLESYLRGKVDESVAIEAARQWLSHECPARLVDDASFAVNALRRELASLTRRGVLEDFVAARLRGEKVPVPTLPFSPEEQKMLKDVRPSGGGKPYFYAIAPRRQTGCPKCHVKIPDSTLKELMLSRVAKCANGCLLISLEP